MERRVDIYTLRKGEIAVGGDGEIGNYIYSMWPQTRRPSRTSSLRRGFSHFEILLPSRDRHNLTVYSFGPAVRGQPHHPPPSPHTFRLQPKSANMNTLYISSRKAHRAAKIVRALPVKFSFALPSPIATESSEILLGFTPVSKTALSIE